MARQSNTGKLPALAVKAAKPKEKPYKLSDGGGLYLLVNPNGSRYWRLKYRIEKKEKVLALGVYPDVPLKEVRIAAEEARSSIRKGLDPGALKKQEKQKPSNGTFGGITQEWLVKENGSWTKSHFTRVQKSLDDNVLPFIGNTPIDKLTSKECLMVIRKIEERGALEVAGRVKQRMAAIFRYAIYTGRVEHNPVDALKDVIQTRKVKHRAALPASELHAFLNAVETNTQITQITRCALQLLVLTFPRPGELRAAKWSEFNIGSKEWRIPAERMKMREEHVIPLSDGALRVLDSIREISSGYDYVFPGYHDFHRPMSENTLTYAIRRRLGFDATAHGFRAVASTVLNEAGFRPDVIERQLAHVERNKVRAAYNRSMYMEERKEMMKWWGDYLDSQKVGNPVIPIRSKVS